MIRKEEYRCAMLAIYRIGRDFEELSKYADKLSYYLRECLEWVEFTNIHTIQVT